MFSADVVAAAQLESDRQARRRRVLVFLPLFLTLPLPAVSSLALSLPLASFVFLTSALAGVSSIMTAAHTHTDTRERAEKRREEGTSPRDGSERSGCGEVSRETIYYLSMQIKLIVSDRCCCERQSVRQRRRVRKRRRIHARPLAALACHSHSHTQSLCAQHTACFAELSDAGCACDAVASTLLCDEAAACVRNP